MIEVVRQCGPGDSIVLNLYTLPRGELDGPQNLEFFKHITLICPKQALFFFLTKLATKQRQYIEW